jgi:hypothetical protein
MYQLLINENNRLKQELHDLKCQHQQPITDVDREYFCNWVAGIKP